MRLGSKRFALLEGQRLRLGWGRSAMVAVVLALVTLALAGSAAAQTSAAITSVSPDSATRSGRVVIGGDGFGSPQGAGRVEIAGVAAPTGSWSDTRIVAYVPESAPLGPVTVSVTSATGATASASLSVTERPPADGRVLWRFEVDADYLTGRPAVGPDGTIYAWDVLGHLYALAPDGGLKWIYQGPSGGNGQVSVGPDGTIYVAGGWLLHAVNPDGTRRWEFDAGASQGIIAGPTVGPDGNVYAIFDIPDPTPGAVSLTPAGEVRWSTRGDPEFREYGQVGKAIAFGSGQLYAPFAAAHYLLYGLTLTGSQRFATPAFGGEAAVGPSGDVYVRDFLSLKAVDPDGNTLWHALSATSDVSSPSVGADGTIYAVEDGHELRALTPQGAIKWTFVGDSLDRPIPSPAGDLVLMGGRTAVAGDEYRGLVQAVDARGRALWQQVFPLDGDGYSPVPVTASTFRPDGAAAYLGLARLRLPNPGFSYLYAIQTDAGSAPAPPPTTDTVATTTAEYDRRKQQLRVEATSTRSGATLTVFVTASGERIGTLSESGAGRYRGQFRWPVNPQSVTVKSSLGGSATRTVTVR